MPGNEFAAETAEPMRVRGGSTGVLLLHGFGGTPASMRPWGEHLAERGYSVSVPLLPGHGTHWRELADVPWTAWYETAEASLLELAAECERVHVAGQSMGGALALRLAAMRPDEVASVALVNPALANPNRLLPLLPVIQLVMKSIPNDGPLVKKPGAGRISYSRLPLRAVGTLTRLWKDLGPRLRTVRQPIVLFRSVADGESGELSSSIVTGATSPGQTREILLHNSYHLASVDYDAELIFEESARSFDAA
ncbi:alpha/beta hydrolase [Glycomyces arizonensis]|uniref:alpha/beta hydrolase n=1 Tax=Glycomyces arizonensis TaxID=256035 RepID=UPI000688CE77|nr:alpha/beta fold hydrolase [Glycomyces arizonensis]